MTDARAKLRWGLIVRLAYAACLLGATVNHVRTVAEHGVLWDYGGVPVASAAFWTSLTVLDPLAAVLLVVRPNAGVLATGAIILSDVAHNLWITARHAGPHRLLAAAASDPFVVSQIAFLLLVAATAPIAWTHGGRPRASKRG